VGVSQCHVDVFAVHRRVLTQNTLPRRSWQVSILLPWNPRPLLVLGVVGIRRLNCVVCQGGWGGVGGFGTPPLLFVGVDLPFTVKSTQIFIKLARTRTHLRFQYKRREWGFTCATAVKCVMCFNIMQCK
jgi:hypothetical protein